MNTKPEQGCLRIHSRWELGVPSLWKIYFWKLSETMFLLTFGTNNIKSKNSCLGISQKLNHDRVDGLDILWSMHKLS